MSLSQPSLSPSTPRFKRKRNGSPTIEQTTFNQRKRPAPSLAITIPSLVDSATPPAHDDGPTSSPISGLSGPDSLFDEASPLMPLKTLDTLSDRPPHPAILMAPHIRGLFFAPTLRLPEELAESVSKYCLKTYFQQKGVNQVMLFERPIPQHLPSSEGTTSTRLPPLLLHLLSKLEAMLLPIIPPETHNLLFSRVPSRARQAILNLYEPGEGITPHVDLLRRFGDGIIGVSFGSGCVMQFARVGGEQAGDAVGENDKDAWDVYLPERSVIVLSEDARYRWTHGIGKHTQDYVAFPNADVENTAGRWIERGVRLSITFRWLLPGADVVGEEPTSP